MNCGLFQDLGASYRAGRRLLRARIFVLLAICSLPLAAGPGVAAVLKVVQAGTTVVSNGSSSAAATISAVDTTKSFLVFGIRHNVSSPADGHITGQITGPTAVTFTRVGNGGDVTVEWSVVEFTSGVSVQRGSESLSVATRNVTLASVNLTRSFPIVSQRVGGTVTSHDDFVRARLTSTTNLELSAYVGRADSVVEWQVVEYADAVVQSGDVSFATGDAAKAITGLSAVDLGKSWLVYSYKSDTGTQANIGQKLVSGLVSGTTSLQFDRDQTGQPLDLTWHLVEFLDDTQVRHANEAFGSSDLQRDVSVSAVDPARSIAVGGYQATGGRSPYSTNDHTGVGWFTAELTTDTNLRLRRGFTGSSAANLGWFVIQFGPELRSASGTVFEDVNYGGGAGRNLAVAAADAPSFSVGRSGVTVELYDAGGGLVGSTTTIAGGSFGFTSLVAGTYTVRVVTDTVTSSRTGSDGSELATQVFRADGMSEGVGVGATKVGGERPSNEDAAANSGAQTLAALQGTDLDADGVTEWTQSIVTVDVSATDATNVDFGFNFDTIVNTNDSGQGSLRQFILNSNLLN